MNNYPSPSPPTPLKSEMENRYRLYIDESGDHVFRKMDNPNHRYLCLLGCWFKVSLYRKFHNELEGFKHKHIPHSPDEPVNLHREDIIWARKSFWRLRDKNLRDAFDADLLELISNAPFKISAVVVDKLALKEKYPAPAHPYHLAMGFLLQRYCGYLNHVNRTGDVLAESRGRKEDQLLRDSYSRVYERGLFKREKNFFQQALSSKKIKIKKKEFNIAGLQLADVLAHPLKKYILLKKGLIKEPLPPFSARLVAIAESKLNHHLYDGRTEGYGFVLFPEK